jgi:hypothetical protein
MAATFIFKLGGQDLSAYLRVNPDDNMDPMGAPFIEPAFTETPFSDGQPLISTTVGNREQTWPLFLVGATRVKDELHALIQLINNAAAVRPLLLEWRDDGASASTFYDVQFVRFEPDYNFRRSQRGYGAGSLHVWTSGYGHTGTTRVTATAAGTGIFLSVPIASLAGDAPALLDTTIRSGAVLPSLGRIVAIAPITNPSYTPRIPAASLTNAQPGATLIGASGADGSQYLALPVSPTGGASGIACLVPLPNPTIAGGDNRILAVVKYGIDAGVAINAIDPYGNAMGATAVASMSQGWGLVDLGVCRLPTTGFPTLPQIQIQAGAIYNPGDQPLILASPAGLALNEIICLPDKNLTLLYERGQAGAASVISRDAFTGAGAFLNGQNDNVGNPWSEAYNNVGLGSAVLTEGGGFLAPLSPLGTGALNQAQASAMDSGHLAGILTDSMFISVKPVLPGGEMRLLKDMATGVFVQARLCADGAKYLDLAAATSTTMNLLASVALASVAAVKLRLSLLVRGGQAIVNLSRDDGGALLVAGGSSAFASLGASSAAVAGAGVPGLSINQGASQYTNAHRNYTEAFSWEVDTLSIASANLQAFDAYRIDGVNADSYRTSSAGVFSGQKLVEKQRGAFAKMQPSTVALAVVCAPVDQGAANDIISAVVAVRERFNYGR